MTPTELDKLSLEEAVTLALQIYRDSAPHIKQRTTTHLMGRFARVLLQAWDEEKEKLRNSLPSRAVLDSMAIAIPREWIEEPPEEKGTA